MSTVRNASGTPFPVVSLEEWTKQRVDLLAKEKEFTRLRDQLSSARRAIPWTKISSPESYVFEGPSGVKKTLADLFEGRSQLVIYHFMFGPDADAGCAVCSFFADSFEGADVHLARRDTTFVIVSRAPVEKIEAYKKRMGWTFEWFSDASPDSKFSHDMGVHYSKDLGDIEEAVVYNYRKGKAWGSEMPGMSIFAQDSSGDVFKTYATFSRGLDILNVTYNILDMTPKGRDEKEVTPFPAAWVKRRDQAEEK